MSFESEGAGCGSGDRAVRMRVSPEAFALELDEQIVVGIKAFAGMSRTASLIGR